MILAGGQGVRLLALTRAVVGDERPKQFCPLLGRETLLEQTRRRAALEIPPARILVSLTRSHEQFYRPLMRAVPAHCPVIQSQGRGTAPAILYGAMRIAADGLAWLMQIVMFLALGLLVFPSRLVTVAVPGLVTAGLLMFVARPVGVFLVLLPSKLPLAAKAMVAWVGLRGAVPIVLATFPLLAGVPRADHLFDLVFFVVLTSVLLQGTSIPAVARWLGVDVAVERRPVPSDISAVATAGALLREIRIPPRSRTAGKRVLDLGLPPGALVVLLKRGDHVIIPDGGTAIEEGDVVVLLADERTHAAIQSLVEGGGERADRPPGSC